MNMSKVHNLVILIIRRMGKSCTCPS